MYGVFLFLFCLQTTTHTEICLYLVNARPVLLVIFLVIDLERRLAPNAKEPHASIRPTFLTDRTLKEENTTTQTQTSKLFICDGLHGHIRV